MTIQTGNQPIDTYKVSTSLYEGPLDLLLELIEKAELDITQLALAQITDQYLEYLGRLEYRDPDEVSAFLVIAARLLQIKSALLLPRMQTEQHQPELDTAEALAQQLIQYRRFKQLASVLAQREDANLRTYLRLAPVAYKAEARLDLTGITLHDLVLAARSVFLKPTLQELSRVVAMPRVTIREKIRAILASLRYGSRIHFSEILQSNNRIEVVVTFLAVLELIKRKILHATQTNTFGDISLENASAADFNGEELAEIDYDE